MTKYLSHSAYSHFLCVHPQLSSEVQCIFFSMNFYLVYIGHEETVWLCRLFCALIGHLSQWYHSWAGQNEPRHEISNNVVCVTSKGSDQPAHMCRLIRVFASGLNILWILSYWQNVIWAATWDFQQCGMCVQQRLRPACAYAQSDQSLCWSLEYSLTVKLLSEQHLEFLSL